MTTLRNFIDSREAEIKTQMKALRAELKELKCARTALSPGDVGASSKTGRAATIKEHILAVLADRPQGATALQIIGFIKNDFDIEIMRTSLSPQLSRLKGDKEIFREGMIWRLMKYAEGSTDETTEPSEDAGLDAGARDEALNPSPEGSIPSSSTQLRGQLPGRSSQLPLSATTQPTPER